MKEKELEEASTESMERQRNRDRSIQTVQMYDPIIERTSERTNKKRKEKKEKREVNCKEEKQRKISCWIIRANYQ